MSIIRRIQDWKDAQLDKFHDWKERVHNMKERYRIYIMPVALLGGFVVDTFTLNKIDQVFDNMILIVHLLIVSSMIAILFSKDTPFGYKYRVKDRAATYNTIMLFSFGGLFSGFVIFYTRSGSLLNSWPFILLMLVLMLATEFKKKYYSKLVAQITLLYIAIFAYMIFAVPLLVDQIGVVVYLVSGGVSLGLISLYLFGLSKVDDYHLKMNFKKLKTRIIAVFLVFNVLYFTNVIPPIPLSLKFRHVYHDFQAVTGVEYRGYYEETKWWNIFRNRSHVFNKEPNEPVYMFSSIFAPVKIKTDIYHVWEEFNKEETRWHERDRIRISIVGGRDDGFRGFSKKSNIEAGQWRVKVVTERNQTIGQIQFKIKDKEPEKELKLELDKF